MPRSVLLGRVPGIAEPLFLPEDTDAVIALAEEEADTCGLCGMPKAWCRDNEVGRARFDLDESFCWASLRIGLRRYKGQPDGAKRAQAEAYTYTPRFRSGYEPDIGEGLSLDGGEL